MRGKGNCAVLNGMQICLLLYRPRISPALNTEASSMVVGNAIFSPTEYFANRNMGFDSVFDSVY